MVDPKVPDQYEQFSAPPLLTTKLYRPPVGPDLEPRKGLLQRLEQNRLRPLTLISAPAGYGKTTLASMWLEACDCASAWISLDDEDNDLRTFTGYMVAALTRAFPDAKFRTQELLQAPLLPPAPTIARYLLNDLEQIEERFVLALDDLYTVHEQAVFDLLGELLRHPSPVLHLLLITRRDPPLPFASLRARRQVTEVRARDLRFDVPAAARLLSRMLQQDVDETIAADWTQRTEGWVTALQLAALSLRHQGQVSNLRAQIPGDNRYLQDYLLAEVIEHLDPLRQKWLLATSLLDRFCAPLVDAICRFDAVGDGDALTGKEFLRWLQKNNLFLIPLDGRHEWFRFHHLFQELLEQSLRDRLGSQDIPTLHLRASKWFDLNGLWDEAIRHAVAAEDSAAATAIIAQHRYYLMNTEQWHRLERWLGYLPDDVVAQDPYLMTIKAHLAVYLQSRQVSEVVDFVRQATQLLAALPAETEESRVLQAEIAVNQGLIDAALGRSTSAHVKAQHSLQALPQQAMVMRLVANTVIAMSLQMQGQYQLSIDRLKEGSASPNLPLNLRAYASQLSCIPCFMEGDLERVLASGHESLRTAQASGHLWSVGYAKYYLGVSHYLRNEFTEAEPYLIGLIEDRAMTPSSYLMFGAFALALIRLTRGEHREADHVLGLAFSQVSNVRDTFAMVAVDAFRVELALRKRNLAEAERLSVGVDFNPRPPIWFFYIPQLTAIKLLWAKGTPESLDIARAALEALDEQMAKINRKTVRIDIVSLLALVCDAQGDAAAACDILAEALRLAEPGGFIRNFVDLGLPMARLLGRLQRHTRQDRQASPQYVARILQAFLALDHGSAATRSLVSSPRAAQITPGMVESLTKREGQVLRLLATDLSPEEIAGELTISTATVRTHTRNIYGKLDVHGRFEAVHRARDLGLLPPTRN